jgi:DNA-binding response OmpR family regulator
LISETASRILIVEDNQELSHVLRELLTRHGYAVVDARHGAEALVHLTSPAASLPDLIILDVNLPLENGVGILGFLRRTLHSTIPVIVLTASATEEQEKELAALGISAYLRKPTGSEVLLREIDRALSP